MTTHRTERASGFIQEELTLLLRGSVGDPRVGPMTITSVALTRDRRIARVYVACYSGEDDLSEGLKGLESAKGFLRRELSQVLLWRFTPELQFHVDRSWQHGARVEALLEELDLEHKDREGDAEESE